MGYKAQAATMNNFGCNAAQESNAAQHNTDPHKRVDEPAGNEYMEKLNKKNTASITIKYLEFHNLTKYISSHH